jgi:hypothetical protein
MNLDSNAHFKIQSLFKAHLKQHDLCIKTSIDEKQKILTKQRNAYTQKVANEDNITFR